MAALSVLTTARHARLRMRRSARLRMRRREHLQLVRAVALLKHSVCIVFTTAHAAACPLTECGATTNTCNSVWFIAIEFSLAYRLRQLSLV